MSDAEALEWIRQIFDDNDWPANHAEEVIAAVRSTGRNINYVEHLKYESLSTGRVDRVLRYERDAAQRDADSIQSGAQSTGDDRNVDPLSADIPSA